MKNKGREAWSCGRKNRKYRGENLNAHSKNENEIRIRGFDAEPCELCPNHKPRHVLRQVFRQEIEQGIEDAMDYFGSDRRRLFARVDPEYAKKVADKTFAKACDCGSVTIDRYGRVHHHFLPRSVRRKCHEERVARREEALKQIAS